MTQTTARRVTSTLLSALYVFAGAVKLYPIIGSVYQEMRQEFVKFANVFPANIVGPRLDPATYMFFVGVLEVSLGLGMMLGTGKVKVVSTGGLMVVMVGATISQFNIGMYAKALFPAGLCLALGYVLNSDWRDEQKKRQ
ncbi:transmembrane protein 35B-like [Haliotis rubra]|uniref:transmembrane protein 35B-like n=1 Tax=Haliotis rubra TaxID=36100 RepID=UPI001EE550D7|nr:transmembrane protein 35B-like [Haliotis rubra]